MGATNIFSYTLSGGSLTINETDNVMKVSIEANAGVVTLQGNVQFKGLASNAINLTVGGGATIIANSNSQPLSGLTINATGGSADILISLV